MSLFFREADISCGVEEKSSVKKWVANVARLHGTTLGEICIVSCSDKHLLGVNRKHLNHDYYTDIITFDYSSEEVVSGDLLISFDRIRENAEAEGVSFQEELRRVIIHGVLHLIGFKDKTESEAQEMRDQENKALEMFHVEQ